MAEAKGASTGNAAQNLLPLKIGLACAGIGGVGGVMFVLVGPRGLLVVPALVVVLGALLLGYRGVIRWLERRRSRPFERRLRDAAAATPRAGADAAKRARLEDIRKRFEEGIEVFRQHGKDLYSVPWYLMVGEPGSGKTEAVRHCGVGFPPGLQNTLQGTGGTLNMNWWFTSHAVILDTAGRLIFEDVEPGGNEWTEFLRMLRSARPNCPINGLLLVLPADSLIRDTAEEIARKSDRIASQLNVIQKALGVRFPVFLLVTKADLINGFREFFDSIKDPLLQHQILGWSNPAPLGEPFEPESVDRLLDTIRQRLRRRRLGLLLDPVHTEDATARRFDQVDALYAYPEAVMQLAPRLRRYLESIFVSGAWGEPPFLRGIYFTSAMREGSALDADLAEALGVPVEGLPEGRVWKKDRSYFLRELFLRKVFAERGLVTRATNVKQMQRRRRSVLLAGGVAAVCIAIGLTWFGGQQFKGALDGHRALWSAARSEFAPRGDRRPASLIVDARGVAEYDGDRSLHLGPLDTTVAGFPADSLEWVSKAISVPAVFAPISKGFGDLDSMRRRAHASVVERAVLVPTVTAVRDRLGREQPETWTEEATRALEQMVRLEVADALGGGEIVDLAPLLRYALAGDPEGGARAVEASGELRRALGWVYSPEGGAAVWPPASLECGSAASMTALRTGVSVLVRHWRAAAADGGLGDVERLAQALAALDDAERRLLGDDGPVRAGAASEFDETAAAWAALFNECEAQARLASEALAGLGSPDGAALRSRINSAKGTLLGTINLAFVPLEDGLRPVEASIPGMHAELPIIKDNIASGRRSLEQEVESRALRLGQQLDALAARHLARDAGGTPAFERRIAAMGRVASELTAQPPAPGETLAGRLRAVDERLAAGLGALREAGVGDAEPRLHALLESASRRQRHGVVGQELARLQGDPGRLEEVVADRAAGLTPVVRPVVPLTATRDRSFDARYHPEAAAWLFETVQTIAALAAEDGLSTLGGDGLTQRSQELREAAAGYAGAYVAYWADRVPSEVSVDSAGRSRWEGVRAEIAGLNAADVCAAIDGVHAAVELALAVVPEWAPETVRRQAGEGAQRVQRERALLRSEAFIARCDRGVRAWGALGAEATRARDVLLALEPGEFVGEYLGARQPQGVRYWNDVGLVALRSLAETTQSGPLQALRTLKAQKGLPLCLGTDRTLTENNIAAAIAAADELRGVLDGAAGSEGSGRTLGGGAATNDDEIDREIGRMRGVGLLPGREGRDWFAQLSAVLDVLRVDGLTYDLVALPAGAQGGDGQDFAQFAVTESGLLLLGADRRSRYFPASPASPVVTVVGQALPGATLEIRFYTGEDVTEPGATAALESPWTGLGAILHGRGELLTGPGLEGVWRAPLSARAPDGTERTYWIGIRPNRPLPPLGRWPTADTWPE